MYSIVNVGGVAAARGDYERAARLLGGGKGMFDRAGVALNPGTAIEYERHVSAVQQALGPERYEQLATEGAGLTDEQLVELALSG